MKIDQGKSKWNVSFSTGQVARTRVTFNCDMPGTMMSRKMANYRDGFAHGNGSVRTRGVSSRRSRVSIEPSRWTSRHTGTSEQSLMKKDIQCRGGWRTTSVANTPLILPYPFLPRPLPLSFLGTSSPRPFIPLCRFSPRQTFHRTAFNPGWLGFSAFFAKETGEVRSTGRRVLSTGHAGHQRERKRREKRVIVAG